VPHVETTVIKRIPAPWLRDLLLLSSHCKNKMYEEKIGINFDATRKMASNLFRPDLTTPHGDPSWFLPFL
jgi:hypothetical protein